MTDKSLTIFTESDLDIIRMARIGMSNKSIAYRMGYSLGDLKTRLQIIFTLAEVTNKSQLIKWSRTKQL
jgi:DNA-binding NarL/FixJ family response regulator